MTISNKIWGALADHVNKEESKAIENNELPVGGLLKLLKKYNLDITSLKAQLEEAEEELEYAEQTLRNAYDDVDTLNDRIEELKDKIND